RADPECATCHVVMDQLGFGLEKYDGIGMWRELDNGEAIDDHGVLPGGISFHGARQLGRVLADDQRFARCLVRNLYIYALGRGTGVDDIAYINGIRDAFVAADYRFEDLAVAIATSDPFL